MDPEVFARALPELFEDFPASPHPRDRRFAGVLEQVPGLAEENNLALLNLAASLLPAGETYLEIGPYRGTSLIAAMLGNDGDFVAVDDFSFRDGSRARLEENLARFHLEGATILEGDAFALLPGGAIAGRRVGVYYYDAGHSYEEQLEALRLVEPYLAPQALLVVDDGDWEQVAAAVRDYLAGQPRARSLLSIAGTDGWWEGVEVLAWRS